MKVRVIQGGTFPLNSGDEYIVGLITEVNKVIIYWIQLKNGDIRGFENNNFESISTQSGLWRSFKYSRGNNVLDEITLTGYDCLVASEDSVFVPLRLTNGQPITKKLFESSIHKLELEVEKNC